MGIASLVLGIVGIIICFVIPLIAPIGLILVIVGLILGIVDTVKKSKRGEKKGIGISGIVICSIAVIILTIECMTVLLGFQIYSTAKKSVLENNMSSIEQQAVSSYNRMLENYKGTQRGTQVRTLIDMAENKNSIDSKTISIYIDEIYTPSSAKNKIFTGKSYEVSFEYSNEGYINRVNINTK